MSEPSKADLVRHLTHQHHDHVIPSVTSLNTWDVDELNEFHRYVAEDFGVLSDCDAFGIKPMHFCAHADLNGEGAHMLAEGEKCDYPGAGGNTASTPSDRAGAAQ